MSETPKGGKARLTAPEELAGLTARASAPSELWLGAGRTGATTLELERGDRQGAGSALAPVEIAFVNLMPDTAFLDTEEQFLGLFSAVSAQLAVPLRVRRFWIRGVPRGPAVRGRIARSYLEIDALIGSQVDALIVTGTEPRAAYLEEEAFWPSLSALILWAREAVPSVLLSCLAAHAAVKLFDGVERTRLPKKLSGVFETDRQGSSPLAEGIPASIRIPHSRSNDIATSLLESRGYRPVLSSGEAWTAVEVTRSQAHFLLFQGHPEYSPNSLLREHRRDVRRYLHGDRATYPPVPEEYLDDVGLRLLDEFASLPSTLGLNPAGIDAFPAEALEPHIWPSWRPAAERLYGNWLGQVVARRRAALGSGRGPEPSAASTLSDSGPVTAPAAGAELAVTLDGASVHA